ncbi:hypothetical protein JDV02_001764 [Purpureocillium takamizusanense]|uniref:Uncharacterized protein n=1 Tax=Purpureocillium takamizusanense TaxID=2060973 RepID=A0A9Q8Q9Z3_9HYPO|nr:uncharacterized protein JDV02_001764 [Purpureocillium takamizusanense]UNI15209.1 hypothetical protein JDV02_001764 [Purpureocillium takamizusanense]
MKKALTILLVGLSSALARAAPAPDGRGMPARAAHPDAGPPTLGGTLQEYTDRTDDAPTTAKRGPDHDDDDGAGGLDKRWDKEEWSKADVICSEKQWGLVHNLAYNDVIDMYEKTWRKGSLVVLPEGPRKCMELFCQYETAFFACNDHAKSYTIQDGMVISHGIREMWKRCHNNQLDDMIGAQIFSPNNWNIIMRRDVSCGPDRGGFALKARGTGHRGGGNAHQGPDE